MPRLIRLLAVAVVARPIFAAVRRSYCVPSKAISSLVHGLPRFFSFFAMKSMYFFNNRLQGCLAPRVKSSLRRQHRFEREHRVEPGGRIETHGGQGMAIDIERGPDLRMAQPLLDDLRMDAGREQQRGRRVPQVVKPNVWKSCRLQEGLEHVGLKMTSPERSALSVDEP